MLPSFSSTYPFFDNNYLFSSNFQTNFPPLAPYVYVFYDPRFTSNTHVLQTQCAQIEVRNSFSSSERQSLGEETPKPASLGSQKSIDFNEKSKEQNNQQPSKSHQMIKQEEKTLKNINQKENQVYRPEESRFVKKNTESNIVSQIFSFLWSPDKHYRLLTEILDQRHKIKVFQALMKSLKSKCRPQLNRDFLKRLMKREQWPASFRKLKAKIRGHQGLLQEELESAFRQLSFRYLREMHRCSILTSKKMNKKLWDTHFKKCNEIKEFLFDKQQD